MSFTDVGRTIAMREGGQVTRCHSLPHIGHYDNAQHQYNVLSIAACMEGRLSYEVTTALLWHDVAERWMGDSPHAAKRDVKGLSPSLKRVEGVINEELGIPQGAELAPWEIELVKVCDSIEFWMWTYDQAHMGSNMAYYSDKMCVGIEAMILNCKVSQGRRKAWYAYWTKLKMTYPDYGRDDESIPGVV